MDFARQQRDPTRHLVGITFVILLHAARHLGAAVRARAARDRGRQEAADGHDHRGDQGAAAAAAAARRPPPKRIEPPKPVIEQPYVPPPEITPPAPPAEPVIANVAPTPPPEPVVIAPPVVVGTARPAEACDPPGCLVLEARVTVVPARGDPGAGSERTRQRDPDDRREGQCRRRAHRVLGTAARVRSRRPRHALRMEVRGRGFEVPGVRRDQLHAERRVGNTGQSFARLRSHDTLARLELPRAA